MFSSWGISLRLLNWNYSSVHNFFAGRSNLAFSLWASPIKWFWKKCLTMNDSCSILSPWFWNCTPGLRKSQVQEEYWICECREVPFYPCCCSVSLHILVITRTFLLHLGIVRSSVFLLFLVGFIVISWFCWTILKNFFKWIFGRHWLWCPAIWIKI